MSTGNGHETGLATRQEDGVEIMVRDGDGERTVPAALMLATQSEIEAQVSTARRYPRSIKRFFDNAIAMATLDPRIAESCLYSVPRGGKHISGPSVRLAEIVAANYGNIRITQRIVGNDTRFVTAEATCHDIESNVSITTEVRRRITDKNGKTFNDDMIGVTGAAALSIARRNAIFQVVPSAYVHVVYREAVEVATGKGKPFAQVRDEWIEYCKSKGVSPDRVFNALGIRGPDDMRQEHIETLIGLRTAIREGDLSLEQAFPRTASITSATAPVPAGTEPATKTQKLAGKLKGEPKQEPALAGREPVSDDDDHAALDQIEKQQSI